MNTFDTQKVGYQGPNPLLAKLLPSFMRTAYGKHLASQKKVAGKGNSVFEASAGLAGVVCAPSSTGTRTDSQLDVSTHDKPIVDAGLPRNMEEKYTVMRELGKGGNGQVRLVVDKQTGEEFACKTLPKVLYDASPKKKAGHLQSIKNEINALRKLKGSLNIIKLEGVYEDDDNIHIVMEYCRGGELWHRIGDRHYSERTVASFMRAVLRTLAQCHSHHILHRDIKPGNFMLLNGEDRSPLKAIDFGLAVPFDPENLPRTDLGLEGTPWYMAPEVLSSQVTPASDLWSAGVMAYQLLTGRFPFDDKRNPFNPSVSAVWKSILTEPLDVDQHKPWWDGISAEAKDFVKKLLNRDPSKRPTAKEALNHPWLRGNSTERSIGKQLSASVVQRIQRFGQNNLFKRSVLQLIAQEFYNTCEIDQQGDQKGVQHSCASLTHLLDKLQFEDEYMDKDDVAEALKKMGYRLEPSEVDRLMEQLDVNKEGVVNRAAFLASQIDWRELQKEHGDTWLKVAESAFRSLDTDNDGYLRVEELLENLKHHYSEGDFAEALEQVVKDAGEEPGADSITFNGFLTMFRPCSLDSLDLYDDRFSTMSHSPGSVDRLNALLSRSLSGFSDGSHHDRSQKVRELPGSRDNSVHNGGEAKQEAGVQELWHNPYMYRPAPSKFNFDMPRAKTVKPVSFDVPTSKPIAVPSVGNNIVNAPMHLGGKHPVDRVRGGGHFDKRMHGASLYRNAVIANPNDNTPAMSCRAAMKDLSHHGASFCSALETVHE